MLPNCEGIKQKWPLSSLLFAEERKVAPGADSARC